MSQSVTLENMQFKYRNSKHLHQDIEFGCCVYHMGEVMRKCVLYLMRTTKVQFSLRIRAVWSAPLLFAAQIAWYVYLLYPKFQGSS